MNGTVASKLNIPRPVDRLLERPQLFRRFDQGLERKLILVSAPAGYGKTTSTAMWMRGLAARHPELGTAWYALSRDDDEFSTFFTRFVAAIEAVVPGALNEVATGVALQSISPQQYSNSLAQACLNLPRAVVLVLDDYHLITAPQIHSVIAHLVQYAADRLHLVIITRHDPPLPIPRLRAQQQIAELRTDALRLDEPESAALLKLRLAEPPSMEAVCMLQERTEGWVAGLQLAAAAMSSVGERLFLNDFRHSESMHVLDFLVDEVLDHVPAETREFLLKTALLLRFNLDLAADVTGFHRAACREILDQLVRQNLFVVVLGREGNWFRYHHQFQAMLVNRAPVLLAQGEAEAIKAQAAVWLAEHGWMDEAFAEHVANRRWEAAADLLELDRHHLQNREEWQALWGRLVQLPQEVIAQRPGLLIAQAWLLQFHHRVAAVRALVEQALGMLSSTEQPVGPLPVTILLGEVDALRGSWIFPDLPIEQRVEHGQAALAVLKPASVYAWVRGFAYAGLTMLKIALGQAVTAQREIMQEIELTGFGSGPYLTRLHQALGTIAYFSGSLTETEQVATRCLALALKHNMPLSAAWARFGLGWVYYQRCEMDTAVEVLLPAIERPHQIHLQSYQNIMRILLPAAIAIGRGKEADRLLEVMRRVALERENLVVIDECDALAAYAAVLRDNRRAALEWAASFAAVRLGVETDPLTIYGAMPQIVLFTKIALAGQAVELVRQAIQPLLAINEVARWRNIEIETLEFQVLLACCYWRTDQPNKAMQMLEPAVEMGMQRGHRWLFFERGADLAAMLELMVRRGTSAESAGKLLAEYNAWAAGRASACAATRPAARQQNDYAILGLTEREVEVLAMLAEGLSNKEIAYRLHLSPLTVRNHLSHVFDKLNVSSRRKAIAEAKALGLLPA